MYFSKEMQKLSSMHNKPRMHSKPYCSHLLPALRLVDYWKFKNRQVTRCLEGFFAADNSPQAASTKSCDLLLSKRSHDVLLRDAENKVRSIETAAHPLLGSCKKTSCTTCLSLFIVGMESSLVPACPILQLAAQLRSC